MKQILALWMGLGSLLGMAQTGQQEIAQYSAERVMKYRTKLGLERDQVDFIRKVYNENSTNFNNLKWDLDEANLQLSEFLDQPKVDSEAAMQLMEKIMALESEIKKKRLAVFLSIKNQLTQEQQDLLADINDTDQLHIIDPRVELKIKNNKGKKEPLYVIEKGKNKLTVEKLNKIDPDEIESIQVLKGPSAIALYGDEGKNGVIVIKMNKGNKK